ncbi:serine hydrolase [Flavobacterium sp. Sd200]|uniref:serine hydrolase n=1 Tax=Flavobacterium sp. Sd200 TaxID=2692211 RepID=UPI00137059F5|nr:serine hydrolase [Flavobacterium sp. Sd200]MXN92632.1 serine hydrolase [Flavobacterium sp. Sd200]
MKKYISLFLVLVTVLSAKAQDTTTYKTVLEKITTGFNSGDYTGIYNLLSAEFKAQVPQQSFTGFLGSQAALGKITATDYIESKDGFRVYKTTFENGVMSLLLACNDKAEISGLALRPYVAKAMRTTPVATDNKKTTPLDKEVDKAVTEFFDDLNNVGAVVAVVKDGATFYYHYGETKKNSGTMPANTTIFEIGSISKTFTGILLAQAVLDKKLSLDDDIRKYLPAECKGLELDGKPVLIKHLANHTSGLPRLTDDYTTTADYNEQDPYKHYTAAMYYNYLARVKLESVPGTKQEYSNTGVAVLGIILEKIYGKSYEQLLATYITNPLKMNSTFVTVPAKHETNFASGYADGDEAPHWNLAQTSAAGGIRSNITDMVLYLKANMAEATPAMALSHKETFNDGSDAIGLGWFLYPVKGDSLIWHNGGTGGFTSYTGYLKDKKVGVVVLTNSSSQGGPDRIGTAILRHLQQ